MIRATLIAVAALFMVGCAATPSSTSADATASTEKVKKNCYRDKSTGSRLGERICTVAKDDE